MTDDISKDESRRILTVATDIRPDENVHDDPAMSATRASRSRAVTAEESRRIMTLATNVRPMENLGSADEDGAGG